MHSPPPYIGLAVHFLVCVALGSGLLGAAALLRYRVRGGSSEKLDTYECGQPPLEQEAHGVPVGFYLVALIFILFDAEAVFLFLWVPSLREVGPAAFWAMVVFLAVLLLGWVYAYRKGDLSWAR